MSPAQRLTALIAALALTGCAAASTPPTTTPSTTSTPLATQPATMPATSLPPDEASATPTPALSQVPVGRIVFDRYRNGPEGTYLGTFLLDASGETQINFPLPAVERSTVLAPDGSTLLVSSYTFEAGSSVGTLDLATGTYVPLETGLTGDLTCTDWLPDGTGVICSLSSERETDDGIYAVSLAGAVTRLTHSEFHYVEGEQDSCGGGEGRAVYSPDGTRFAYEQQRCGALPAPGRTEQGSIVVADADGSNPVTVVPFGGVRTHPGGEISWSPVNDRIAFATQDGVLSIVNADGTHKIEVPMPGFVLGPAWSPDGNWILVGVDTGRGADLYAVSSHNATTMQLTRTPDFEVFTDWGASAP
jgi:Tol biopolymer transport system component